MSQEPNKVMQCPACGQPVEEGEPSVAAYEGEAAPGFGSADDVAWSTVPTRFHERCFRPRIGLLHYQVVDASRSQ